MNMENELFYTYSEAAMHLRRYIAEYMRLNEEWRTSNYGKYIAARMREVDEALGDKPCVWPIFRESLK